MTSAQPYGGAGELTSVCRSRYNLGEAYAESTGSGDSARYTTEVVESIIDQLLKVFQNKVSQL